MKRAKRDLRGTRWWMKGNEGRCTLLGEDSSPRSCCHAGRKTTNTTAVSRDSTGNFVNFNLYPCRPTLFIRLSATRTALLTRQRKAGDFYTRAPTCTSKHRSTILLFGKLAGIQFYRLAFAVWLVSIAEPSAMFSLWITYLINWVSFVKLLPAIWTPVVGCILKVTYLTFTNVLDNRSFIKQRNVQSTTKTCYVDFSTLNYIFRDYFL